MNKEKSNYFGEIFANRDSVWLELESDTQPIRQRYFLDLTNETFFKHFSPSIGGLLYCFDKQSRIFGRLSQGRISEIDFIETFEGIWTEMAILNPHHVDLSCEAMDETCILQGKLEISQNARQITIGSRTLAISSDYDLYQWCDDDIPFDGQEETFPVFTYDKSELYGRVSDDGTEIAMLGLSIEVCELHYRLGDCGVLRQGPAKYPTRQ